MARRRINTRLIVIVGSVGVVGLFAAAGVYKLQRVRHPEPYIAAGDDAVKQRDFAAAADNYRIASDLRPQDATLHLKLGKAYFQLRNSGSEYFHGCITELTKAEELDPTSIEAWGGLLSANEYQVSLIESLPGNPLDRAQLPESLSIARDAANHLVKLDPNNVAAQVALSSLNIRAWLLKLAIPQTAAERDLPADQQKTDDQKVDQAVSDLTQLMAKHPDNDSIPYWIARAKINQAVDSADPNDAIPLYAEAAAEFDTSISAQPKNINLYLKKADILQLLIKTDTSSTNSSEYRSKLHDTLDLAQGLAELNSPDLYQTAKTEWARHLIPLDPGRAEAVYRDLVAHFPDTIEYRIELAELLHRDVSRQPEALAVLDAIPSTPPPSVVGFDQQQYWTMGVSRSKLSRASIETDQLQRLLPGQKRDDLIADIDKSLAIAANHVDGTYQYLRTRGRFELASGRVRDAIQTLGAAKQKMQTTGVVDFDLLRDLAMAYQQGGQVGEAITVLETAMKEPQIANNGEIHQTLATLHLQNKDYVRAKPYVDWLALRYPEDPGVIALEIQSLGTSPDADTVKALYDKLPEKSMVQKRSKLNVAANLNMRADEVRLLVQIYSEDPNDSGAVRNLIRIYTEDGKKDEAQAILDSWSKSHPQDPNLKGLADVINNATPEKLVEDQMASANAIKDPFSRESALAALYGATGQPDEQLKHLLAAAQIRPDDTGILQQIFMRYMTTQRFNDAAAMLPHLSDLDADQAHGEMFKSKLALARRDIPTALATGRQLTHDYPEFSTSWEQYGEALRANGQLEAACQQFIAARDKQATNIDSTRNLIQCSVQLGKLDDARRYINEALARFPGDPAYRDMQVQFEILFGDPESVVPDLQRAVEAAPDNRKNYAIAVDALLASVRVRAGKGDVDGANKYLADARKLFETATSKWPDELTFANGLANICLQSHDLPGAEAALQRLSDRPLWKNQATPLVKLAEVYLRAGKPEKALPLLVDALNDDPHSIDARVTLANTFILMHKYDEALQTLKPATDEFSVLEKYTNLLLAMNRGAEAEDLLVSKLKTDPQNSGLTDVLINIYQSEHKRDQALDLASKAITNDPSNLTAFFYRGMLLASGATPDLDAAQKDLRFYCDSMPSDFRGHMALAEVLDGEQEHDPAISELQIAVKSSPLDRQPRLLLLQDYLAAVPPRSTDAEELVTETVALPEFQHDPQFLMQAAWLSAKQGDSDKAITYARTAMDNVPDKSVLVNDYLAILVLCKQYDQVLEESKNAAGNPDTAWVVFSDRGIAKFHKDDLDGAAAEFKSALDRAGVDQGTLSARKVTKTIVDTLGVDKAMDLVIPRAKNSKLWSLVAIAIYEAKKNYPAALASAESVMGSFDTLIPDDQYYLLDLSSSLYIQTSPPQVDKAVAAYHKMLDLNPRDVNAMNNIACVLNDMSTPARPQDALVWSQKAFDLIQKSGQMIPTIYDTHGWVLISAGRLDDGIEVLHQGIDKCAFPDAYYHLGEAYLKKNQPKDAQRELAKAMEMLNAPKGSFVEVDTNLRSKVTEALKQANDKVQADEEGKPAA